MILFVNEMAQRFFIFANRLKNKYGDLDNFLLHHPDYNNAVYILLNTAEPLSFSSVIEFPKKWIFFRVLSDTSNIRKRTLIFRDLTLLQKYDFEQFGALPDQDEPYQVFLDRIKELNIDNTRLYPYRLSFNQEHFHLVHKLNFNVKPWAKQKTLSSGLWLYIHLKERYPLSSFTFVGFNGNIGSQFHNPSAEQQYLKELFMSKNVETHNCIME